MYKSHVLSFFLRNSILIVPIHIFIFQIYYEQEIVYSPGVGHLWFLLNICIYVTQIIGFAFLEKNYDYKFFNFFRKLLNRPYLIYLFLIPFILEAELVNPEFFSLYVGTGHGFLLGMLAFFFGFLFIALGDAFWNAVVKMKTISLIIAFILYLVRLFYFELTAPNFLTSIESMNWIFAIFGFGYTYLNKPGKILSYLSQAAYPVYIIHMIFLYLASYFILPYNLPVELKLILIVVLTFVGSFLLYDLFIRRVAFVRPLFGLKSFEK